MANNLPRVPSAPVPVSSATLAFNQDQDQNDEVRLTFPAASGVADRYGVDYRRRATSADSWGAWTGYREGTSRRIDLFLVTRTTNVQVQARVVTYNVAGASAPRLSNILTRRLQAPAQVASATLAFNQDQDDNDEVRLTFPAASGVVTRYGTDYRRRTSSAVAWGPWTGYQEMTGRQRDLFLVRRTTPVQVQARVVTINSVGRSSARLSNILTRGAPVTSIAPTAVTIEAALTPGVRVQYRVTGLTLPSGVTPTRYDWSWRSRGAAWQDMGSSAASPLNRLLSVSLSRRFRASVGDTFQLRVRVVAGGGTSEYTLSNIVTLADGTLS